MCNPSARYLVVRELLERLRGRTKICGCGRPLSVVRDRWGRPIGLTHTPEDEEWHCACFAALQVRLCEPPPGKVQM